MKNWNLVSRANGISYWLLSKKVGLFKYLFQLREIYQRLFQYIDKRNNKISGIWKKIRLKENSIVYYSCGKRSKETTKDWFVIELWLKLFFTVFTKIQKNYHLKIYSECQYFAITLQSRHWIQWWRSIEETKVAFSNWNSTSMFFVCCLLIRHRVSWHYIRVCATKVLVDEWFIVLSREKIYSCVQRKLFFQLDYNEATTLCSLRRSGRICRDLVNFEFVVSIETTDSAWPITRIVTSINWLINTLINSFDRF